MRRIPAVLACAAAASLLPILAGCRGGRYPRAVEIVPGGNARLGASLIEGYRCGACHTIPGIKDADGLVGPPLTLFARRTYIAGELPNTPPNLIRWIRDPPAVEPGTAMPVLGLSRRQAADVAAYLYTLR